MAVSASSFDALGGAVSAIFGGVGELDTAKGYTAAAGLYTQQAAVYGQAIDQSKANANVADLGSQIQEMQSQRSIYQTLGGQRSDIAGAGLMNSGSSLDLIRSSAQQGALTQGLLKEQGALTQGGYKEEALSYAAMQGAALASSATASAEASAATASGTGGILGGIVKGIGAVAGIVGLFSDARLKENISLVGRRADGLGRYVYNYVGTPELTFVGVMADEVEALYPQAVVTAPNGFKAVDYAAIGETLYQLGTV